ncbi:energy transducer TonB [Hymenobacter cellulosivorans]|uniref:Energy transducer TonB n=1 Tax=Hymenobacter cellulosivorans TaxID=2932249 RepID=A0ABY4FE66_9BACT|nr:energy transducer TonB [Hymenobacter cellulosivorans]UOQ54272.1 energy transducer TonB [Hymenobacter cellulosivorans]
MKRRLLFYSLFLLTAVGCQREKPVQSEASKPVETAPALADSLPEAPATGAVNSRSWHQLGRRTSRTAPLVVYQRGTLRAPGSTDTTALPPSEARLHDLTLKASEYFKIDPTQPAEVHGREGTVVRIPAGALVDNSNRVAANPVWVEMKECYSVADMLLSNLTTVTPDGELLESGGIVLVRASARGQQLRLAPGQAFQLEMPGPASRRKELKLFYGQGGRGQQPVRWIAAGPAADLPPPAPVASNADQMPTYGNGPADINKLVRYPQTAVENKTEGIVYASFMVDEQGRVEAPSIVRGIGGGCDEEVLRVLRQTSGHWTPARSGGQLVKVKMMLPIRFSFHEGLANSDETAVASADTAGPTPVALSTDDDAPEEQEASDRRVFTCRKLGWLNADKPVAMGQSVDFTVPVDVEPGTSIRLVVEGSAAIAEAQPQADGYAFQGIPGGRKVLLIGTQYRNGTPYLAMRRTVAGQASSEALVFQETTLEDLERAIEKIQ